MNWLSARQGGAVATVISKRPYTLSPLYTVLLCMVLLSVVFSSAALSQERPTVQSLDARVQRLERILDQAMLEQFQRVDALQQEIRLLLGEIEGLRFELNQLQKSQIDLYDDADQRISELEQQSVSVGAGGVGSLADDAVLDGSLSDQVDEAQSAGSEAAAQTLIVPAETRVASHTTKTHIPLPGAESFGDGPFPPQSPIRATGSNAEKLAYNAAYEQLARGQAEQAILAFGAFLQQYPDGPYSDNAWYWQGEAMYAKREYVSAQRNFAVVVHSFPESLKLPDARLKAGMALFGQQQYEQARTVLTGVQDDYPGRSVSVLARKHLQKMDRDGL